MSRKALTGVFALASDEEISAMRLELEKYGIQMPAFSKIGGILANEMPVDEAALHAAVIAINDAIDKQVTYSRISRFSYQMTPPPPKVSPKN